MDQTVMFFLGLGAFFFLITSIAILDIASKDFGGTGKKLAWGFAVAMIPFFGCVAYFVFGFRKGKKPENAAN